MNEEAVFDVAPDEEKTDDRRKVTVFFQVLKRKFWKLISMNLAFLLLNIPSILISFFLSGYIADKIIFTFGTPDEIVTILFILFVYCFPILMFMMAVPVITVGPAQAGLTYILRCFSYELPTFYWSDFKDKAKENFKKSMIVCLINIGAIFVLFLDFYLYEQIARNSPESSKLLSLAFGLLFVVLIIFQMMCMYIYPMMVTYELKIKHLYKNAFLFSISRFFPNTGILFLLFLILVAPILIVIFTVNTLVLTLIYIYYIVLGFTLPGLIINAYINPIIDKYLRPGPKKAEKIS